MSETSAPMTVGLILSRIFELLRVHWRVLLGVTAVPVAAMVLLLVAAIGPFEWMIFQAKQNGAPAPTPAMMLAFVPLMLVAYLLVMVLMALNLAASSKAAVAVNRGETVSVRSAWCGVWARAGRYLWLMIRQCLVLLVPVAAVGAVIIGGAVGLITAMHHTTSNPNALLILIPIAVLCYLAVLVYMVWIGLRFSFSYIACVAEDASAAVAMSRSWQLTRGAVGKIFLVMLIIFGLIYAAEFVLILMFYFVIAVGAIFTIALHVHTGSAAFIPLIGFGVLIFAALMMAIMAITHASYTVALAVLYDDQRLRIDNQTPAIDPLPTAEI